MTETSLFQKLYQETVETTNQLYSSAVKKPSTIPDEEQESIARSVRLIQEIMEKNRQKQPSYARRYNLFPIKDEESYRFFKKQEASIWSANEIDFFQDRGDYKAASPRERRLIDLILGFFAPGDGMISNNLSMRFIMESSTYEQQAFFIAQMFIELVHAETYGLMIMSLIPEERQKELFELVDNVPYVKAKAEFMEHFTQSNIPQCDRFAAFATAEGIFFSVLFMIIFWFRSKGKFTSLTFANEQISKDECLHRDYGALRWRQTSEGDPDAARRAMTIILTGVAIERAFLDWILEEALGELCKELAHGFLETVTNSLLAVMGLPAYFKEVPLPSWMNDISLTQKNNFYEVRVGSYGRFSVEQAMNLASGKTNPARESKIFDDPTSVFF